MPNPVCPTCAFTLKLHECGVAVIEMFRDPPQPYKIWFADLLRCPKCGTQVIDHFADKPFAEHFQSDFAECLTRIRTGELAKRGLVFESREK